MPADKKIAKMTNKRTFPLSEIRLPKNFLDFVLSNRLRKLFAHEQHTALCIWQNKST